METDSIPLLSSERMFKLLTASFRSVGTAITLAAVGIYLHRRGFISADGKRTLALISQQVTIPLLFFTKMIYCDKHLDDACPDVAKSFENVWMLLLWPCYVVALGLSVGYAAAVISKTPSSQVRAVLAACAFSNSTGLPITLLTVIHTNFPPSSDLGRTDPCLLLSVYLLLYPALQWGIGGWLLEPSSPPSHKEVDIEMSQNIVKDSVGEQESSLLVVPADESSLEETIKHQELSLLTNALQVAARFFKPPVVGALLGMLIASTPALRGIFVDVESTYDSAPLEWLFDGLYAVGQSAVPINMMILGTNLSASCRFNQKDSSKTQMNQELFSRSTMTSIVLAKLLILPWLGFLSVFFFRTYFWNIPDDIRGSFYLVVLIVFLTPTANNVMVMVELSGSEGAKDGIARVIAWQYVAAPILLTINLTMAVGIADHWS